MNEFLRRKTAAKNARRRLRIKAPPLRERLAKWVNGRRAHARQQSNWLCNCVLIDNVNYKIIGIQMTSSAQQQRGAGGQPAGGAAPLTTAPAAAVAAAGPSATPQGQIASPANAIPFAGMYDAHSSVKTGLGDDIDAIINSSPTLANNIRMLIAQKWTIKYGEAGAGTNADRGATTITVDPDEKNAKDQDGKNIGPIVIAQSLAHETGHALFDNSSTIDPETSSRKDYVNDKVQRDLENEGEATIMNIEVQREILRATQGKVDIGIAGTQSAKYLELFNECKNAKDPSARATLRKKIAQLYGTGERPSGEKNSRVNYAEHYGKQYGEEWDNIQQAIKAAEELKKKPPVYAND